METKDEGLQPDPRGKPCEDDYEAKGDIPDSKPWAKSADMPSQSTPFRSLRQR